MDLENLSEIQKFYSGQSVLITGTTGFVGKVLLEKLLRSCSHINTIYVLMREKKDKDMYSRLEDIFNCEIFQNLKEKWPKFESKVRIVAGDCLLPNLGLSDSDIETIINNVSIVFHVAATVRFDESLRRAVNINLKSTIYLTKLFSQLKERKVMVHVSTTYSNCTHDLIEEKFYQPKIDSLKMMQLVDSIDSDEILDSITASLIQPWPNTYVFTKSIAEHYINTYCSKLPIGIFRPGIIISSYKEPINGWIDNFYGPTGVCAGAGFGIIHTMHCDSKINANIVPVDMVVNGLICSAWDISNRFKIAKNDDVIVYNYSSQKRNPIDWGTYMEHVHCNGIKYPTSKALWYYSLTLNKNRYVHATYDFFLHLLPALLIDTILYAVGKKPRLFKLYQKIQKFSLVLTYFSLRNWKFDDSNVQTLWKSISDEDRDLFFFDIEQLNWSEYFIEYIKGLRLFLIRDPLETLPEARARWKRLYIAHQLIKVMLIFLLTRLFYEIFF